MQPLSGPGLVLRRTRLMEEDVRLIILMRDFGKFSVVSRGGMKFGAKLKAIQEPFTEADFHLSATAHGVHARLLSGRLIQSFPGLPKSLDAFSTAARCVDVVDASLPHRAPSPDVFDILRLSLLDLSKGESPESVWLDFCLLMLRCLGYGDLLTELIKIAPEFVDHGSAGSIDVTRWRNISETSRNRCRAFLESRLEHILPRPLNPGVLSQA
jgi:DNA repair protein RecO